MPPCEFYKYEGMHMKRTVCLGSASSVLKRCVQERLRKRPIPITNESDLGEPNSISGLMSHGDVSGLFRELPHWRRIAPEYAIFCVGKCEITHMPLSLMARGY